MEHLPNIEDINLESVFAKLKIEFMSIPFMYKTPKNYFGSWRNQFFEFSIFNHISNNQSFDEGDNFCLIDSDCVISKSLDEMFKDIKQNKYLHYLLTYNEDHIINGLSRTGMKGIFEDLTGRRLDEPPNYYAGEFFASKIEFVKQVDREFQLVWPKLIERSEKKQAVLNEEAHVLSYIFHNLQMENSLGDGYVKRLWTDPTTLRNVEKGDENLSIWHLPAEKRIGFKKLFKKLSGRNFDISSFSSEEFNDLLKRNFSIPNLSTKQKIYYSVKRLAKKILKK